VAYAYQSFDGEQFSSDDFATSFSRTFRKVQLELEKKISGLQNVVLDLQTKAIPVGIREFLSRNNVNVDLFTVNKIPLMVNCYIDSVYRDLNYYPYSKSVFLTRKEFTELVGFLERIRDGSVTQDETRKNVYNAIFEQIKSYFGKKEVKKAVAYMKTKSGRDFFRSLTGCDPNSPYIRKLNSLNDILKENVFTAEDMNAFVVDCKSKLNRLNNQSEMKRYSFEGTEQDYIWLPVTLLP
jgi:hypothetical protein